MRENYDRLVLELGVSPRGSARHGAAAAAADAAAVRLPRVPQSRHWEAGKGSPAGSQSARKPGLPTRGKAGGVPFEPLAASRMLAKVDAMAEAGTLSATEAKKMRKLWSLQEQLLTKMSGGAVAGTDEEALVSAMHSVMSFLDDPDAALRADAALAAAAPPVDAPAARADSPPVAVVTATPASPKAGARPPPAASTSTGTAPLAPAAARPPSVTADAPMASAASAAPAGARASGGASDGARDADPQADAAFAKVERLVAASHAKVFEYFKRMDADGDGCISPDEMFSGFFNLGIEVSRDDVNGVFRKLEPGAGVRSMELKKLRKAFRSQSTPAKSVAGTGAASTNAADQPISAADLRPEGMTEEDAELARAEANLRAGRLPSLSPEEDDDAPKKKGGGGGSSKGGNGAAHEFDYVWQQLQSRIAPDGTAAAPPWQREMLESVHWQVQCKRGLQVREQRAAKLAAKPNIPSWDKPARPVKRNLIDNELRRQRLEARYADASAKGRPSSASGSAREEELGESTRSFDGDDSDEPAPLTMGLATVVVPNHAKLAIENCDPEDTSIHQVSDTDCL
jgi:hypothetical protein